MTTTLTHTPERWTPAAPALDGMPLTVGLAGREVLLVGAGPVSVRRAEAFLEAGAHVRVVAPEADPAMAELAAGADLVVVTRTFTSADLDTPWLVHVATGDPAVDAEVARLCDQRRLWCVTAGDAAVGSTRVPSRTAVQTPAGPVRVAVDSGDPRRSVRVGRHVARTLATEPLPLRPRRRRGPGWSVELTTSDADPADWTESLTIRGYRALCAADVVVTEAGLPHDELGVMLEHDVEVVTAADGAEGGPGLPDEAVAALVDERVSRGLGVVRVRTASRDEAGWRQLGAVVDVSAIAS